MYHSAGGKPSFAATGGAWRAGGRELSAATDSSRAVLITEDYDIHPELSCLLELSGPGSM